MIDKEKFEIAQKEMINAIEKNISLSQRSKEVLSQMRLKLIEAKGDIDKIFEDFSTSQGTRGFLREGFSIFLKEYYK